MARYAGARILHTLLWILCAGSVLLVASLLPVLPVEETAVVAPIPGSDGRLHHPSPQAAVVPLARLFVPMSGKSYAFGLWSWIVLGVLLVGSAYLGRLLSRWILRRKKQSSRGDPE